MTGRWLLLTVLATLLVSSGAAGAPATVDEVKMISGPSPIAGTCPVNDRRLLYGTLGGEELEKEEEVGLAINPTDPANMVVAWAQDSGLGIVAASTKDGGETWKRVVVPGFTACTGGDLDRAIHARTAFGPDGVVYVAATPLDGFAPFDPRAFVSRVAVSRSFDGGETWLGPVTLEALPVLNDFDTIATEPDAAGAIDVLWSPTEAVLEPILLSRSTDHGETWIHHEVRPPMPGMIAANRIVAHADGTLLVFIHDLPIQGFAGLPVASPISVTRSEDKGQTWSEPVVVAPHAGLYSWPITAVTPDGAVHLAWRSVGEDGAHDVWHTRSADGGATWSTSQKAFSYVPWTSPDLPEPTMAAGADGSLAIVYYDRRTDTPGDDAEPVEFWLAHSHDDGASWTQSPVAGPFDLGAFCADDPALLCGPGWGFLVGLEPTPCGFAAAFPLGRPLATNGKLDVFLATVSVGESCSA